MCAHRESAALAERLIAETIVKQGVASRGLGVHADRGSSMTSKPLALVLADLGVTKTHSRPHVSNDNPYSEAQFKTLKFGDGEGRAEGCPEWRIWSALYDAAERQGVLWPAASANGAGPHPAPARVASLRFYLPGEWLTPAG
jgi:transposase InsO family protein